MKALPIKTRHTLMTCPACSEVIDAAVTVDPQLGTPSFSATRHVTLPVNPRIERFVIVHHCEGRSEPDAGEVRP